MLCPGRPFGFAQGRETALGTLLDEIEPGARVRFAEMDVTDLKVDGEFYQKMIEAGVYSAEEVKQLINRSL